MKLLEYDAMFDVRIAASFNLAFAGQARDYTLHKDTGINSDYAL